ncbi:hypothetical protein SCLCIDRAFT_24971 [Scleroderma citrinum Foug A]|uniref:Uncharacterized protein n=1 Tax=Scleroderma citrinum Foug A TaxID=1036808 RepID=A0A0C3DP79_9AGAM|nr:hypothetical protein SCLCIDRAFT_24971 [Scleroderma citrinum Foug A]
MDFQRSTAKRALARPHNNFCAATDLLLSYPFPYPPDHDRDPELELEPGLKPEPEPQYVETATATSINFGSPTGSKTPSHYVYVHLLRVRIGSPCVGFAYDKLTATKLGPNTMTFVIPSEAFPMHYRLTAQDISAASGKLSAIAAQLVDIGEESSHSTYVNHSEQ